MKKILPLGRPLKGSLRVPGDKSIAHRALILGALCDKGLRVGHIPNGQDVRSTRRCLETLGVAIRENKDGLTVGGGGMLKPWKSPGKNLDCGNSGTTMRLMMGVLSGMPLEATLAGDASLSRRPMGRVAEPLRAMDAEIGLAEGKYAPVHVRGRKPLKAAHYHMPVPSAQVKSAVLLAGLSASGETIVTDPFDSRDHTERMLAWLNPKILRREGPNIHLRPGKLTGGRALKVPGDISSAAFFLAAASIVEGSEVLLTEVGVNPTRMGFVEALREMGAHIDMENSHEEAGEPVANLRVVYAPLKGVTIPAQRVPALIDEAPLLAVVAAAAHGMTRLEGLEELRLKESDRLDGTAQGLRAMGVEARVDGDALEVRGKALLKGAVIETQNDHRLAMAFAVAALLARGETTLSDAQCAAISYPEFFDDLEGLCP